MATKTLPMFCGKPIPPRYWATEEAMQAQVEEAVRQLEQAKAANPEYQEMYDEAIKTLKENNNGRR